MKKESIFQKVDLTALKQSFIKACSDSEFKQYIYKLGVSEDVLMKYTSILQDSFCEYQNCLKCKGFYECKNEVKGYCYTPRCKNNIITCSYKACKYKEEIDLENAYKKNVTYFELSEDNQNASFKDVYKDDKARVPIIKYFKEFSSQLLKGEKPKGMYLYGSFGSGKTYLISALFNELAKKNIKSILIHYPMFLKKLKSSFDSDYDDILDSVMKTPLLLIDDIGSEKETDWSRDEVLMSILQYRMDNHLSTFFTTNLTLEDLEKSLSITSSGVDKIKARRIMERIKQLTVYYELVSKNRRV